MAQEKIQGGFVAGIKHFFAAFYYSMGGLAAGFRLSLSFRQEVATLFLLCILLYFFDKPASIAILSIFMWLCVLVAELLNTALEECVDMISKDYSLTIKAIKDMGSASVFIFLMGNLFGQMYVFWDELVLLYSLFLSN